MSTCVSQYVTLTSGGSSGGAPTATLTVNGAVHPLFNDANTGPGLNVWVTTPQNEDRFAYFDGSATHTFDTGQNTAGSLFNNLITFFQYDYKEPDALWGVGCGDVVFLAAKDEAAAGICPDTGGTSAINTPCSAVTDFAEALTSLVTDPDRAATMGRAGRRRAVESFGWPAIAERTMEVYRSVL